MKWPQAVTTWTQTTKASSDTKPGRRENNKQKQLQHRQTKELKNRLYFFDWPILCHSFRWLKRQFGTSNQQNDLKYRKDRRHNYDKRQSTVDHPGGGAFVQANCCHRSQVCPRRLLTKLVTNNSQFSPCNKQSTYSNAKSMNNKQRWWCRWSADKKAWESSKRAAALFLFTS